MGEHLWGRGEGEGWGDRDEMTEGDGRVRNGWIEIREIMVGWKGGELGQ